MTDINKEEIVWEISLFLAQYKKSPPDERPTDKIANDLFDYLLQKLDCYCS